MRVSHMAMQWPRDRNGTCRNAGCIRSGRRWWRWCSLLITTRPALKAVNFLGVEVSPPFTFQHHAILNQFRISAAISAFRPPCKSKTGLYQSNATALPGAAAGLAVRLTSTWGKLWVDQIRKCTSNHLIIYTYLKPKVLGINMNL